jgi:hypothetical protein
MKRQEGQDGREGQETQEAHKRGPEHVGDSTHFDREQSVAR